MTFLIFLFLALVFLAVVGMPFFALGLKRLWIVAAVFWIPATSYAAYVWTLSIDPAEDWQMAQLWRMILLAVVVTALTAFVGGMLSAQFGRRRGIKLEETSE